MRISDWSSDVCSSDLIAIERVVMCHERPRRRAASDRLQHRRLDFDEAECIEKIADEANALSALFERALDLRIDDQIDVALTIADLGIGQSRLFLRQRANALDQQFDLLRLDRQFTGLGFEHRADRKSTRLNSSH